MPTPDQSRLEVARARPRIMELWWALRPLASVVRLMQSGAHPDDEISDMLAALSIRDGINLSYACSTRGEGGQNDIGTETGAALGALRTREMERACNVLNMRMYWHSEDPDDRITDFGFSKSGDETLERWDMERTLSRFVEIVRTDRPDILCPTFLDVPGQHGHHRAMTRAAHDVMEAAASPAFPSNLPPWQIKKLYLPAWSGAGQAYDDDAPPPPATMSVQGGIGDPISGWSWPRIGQMSRAFHRTQGMGRWTDANDARDWPLHLVVSHVDGPDNAVWSGLPRTVSDLAALKGAGAIAEDLRAAQTGIDEALAAFPNFETVTKALAPALAATRRAQAHCPEKAQDEILHRLSAKETQLAHALRHALGIDASVHTDAVFLRPGDRTDLTIETSEDSSASLDLPTTWRVDDGILTISSDAPPSDAYRATYDPSDPPQPSLQLSARAFGVDFRVRLPFDAEPIVLPARSVTVAPDAMLLNTSQRAELPLVRFTDLWPEGAKAVLHLPDGWAAKHAPDGLSLMPPDDVAPGLYRLPVTVDGAPAYTVRRIAHPHIADTAYHGVAHVRLRVLHASVPDVKVGYIGAGNDRVGHWLATMGAKVADVSDDMLTNGTALAEFDTLVIGIFAMRFRPGLAAAMPHIHRWTNAGGTLVTLYHRPWDNWDPNAIPPRRIEIGQPSLRWRVTDENAAVRHLFDHPLLSTPNKISASDWDGWVKERGLYFAKSWDEAYTPLLEMADPGEAAHRGSLLVADVGTGRHVHTSLILHHQMEHLVPGAFRLMANLIAKRA
ncbi:MAG: PIG-L family deacetylase [Pseudomonadota bacterium]